jgi:hypothetical protein
MNTSSTINTFSTESLSIDGQDEPSLSPSYPINDLLVVQLLYHSTHSAARRHTLQSCSVVHHHLAHRLDTILAQLEYRQDGNGLVDFLAAD